MGHAARLRISLGAALVALSLPSAGCVSDPEIPAGALVTPMRRDPPAGPAAQAVVAFAAAQVGRPYCWGGAGPRCFDCSGLTMTAWKQVGVRIPRTADAIAESLPEVALDEVRPGDILWWPGHVGIYAGNGWSIEALGAQWGVVVRRATSPHRAYRPAGATPPWLG